MNFHVVNDVEYIPVALNTQSADTRKYYPCLDERKHRHIDTYSHPQNIFSINRSQNNEFYSIMFVLANISFNF